MALLQRLGRCLIPRGLLSSQLRIAEGFGAGLAPAAAAAAGAGAGPAPAAAPSLLGFLRQLSTRSSSSGAGLQVLLTQQRQRPAAGRWAWQLEQQRGMASKLTPRFTGCKLKPYS